MDNFFKKNLMFLVDVTDFDTKTKEEVFDLLFVKNKPDEIDREVLARVLKEQEGRLLIPVSFFETLKEMVKNVESNHSR